MAIYLKTQTQSFQHHSQAGKWQDLNEKIPGKGSDWSEWGHMAPLHCLRHPREWNILIGQMGIGLALSTQMSRLGGLVEGGWQKKKKKG